MKALQSLGLGLLIALSTSPVLAVTVGTSAPEFTASALGAKQVKLSDYKGKYVVLEWHNQGCPFVQKHYNSGNMESLQKEWTKKGVIWLTVISSAPGKEGYVGEKEERSYLADKKAAPTEVILDPEGKLGRMYAAKTTPHMFVIDKTGKLIYNGAIDDKPTTDLEDVKGAHNYVSAALEEAQAGKAVTVASTQPYGCSVKYKD